MRKLAGILVLAVGLVGTGSPALALDDNEVPPGIEKFGRGLVNVAAGAPDEVIAHTLGAATAYNDESLGGFVTSLIGGAIVGTFWGVARVGSGIVDVFTFPVPFDEDNSPLLEPDFHN